MFSKAEMEFLREPKRFNDNYERSLTHRILNKLKDFEEALPLLEKNTKTKAWLDKIVAKNSSVAVFSSSKQVQEKPNLSPVPETGWCSGRDSDPGRELERLSASKYIRFLDIMSGKEIFCRKLTCHPC